MKIEERNIKIFAGNSHPSLASEIACILGMPVGESTVGTFSDGEISVNICETVRGVDVFVIQSISAPVNNNLMELLIIIDALKRASAGRITAVIPYYGYARQDRKAKARDPITAKLVADLLTSAGANRILTMDLHASQVQGYFDIPVDHLLGTPILAKYYIQKGFRENNNIVVVSPDAGSVARARKFADKLDAPIAIIDKRKPRANVSETINVIGDIKDKKVLLVDDIIDTAVTITNGANALIKLGAKEVYACCTHAILSDCAIKRLNESNIKELVILNTISLNTDSILNKVKILSVAPVFAEAIRRIYEEISISKIFED